MRERLSRLPLVTWAMVSSALLGPLVIWGLAQGFRWAGESDLDVMRAACGVLLGGLLLASGVLYRSSPKARRALVVAFAALGVWSSVLTVDVSLRRHLGTPRQVSTWNFFHYYLGGKYFAEVGYDGLYEEAIKADYRGAKRFKSVSRYRDMETYRMKSAAKIRKEPRRPEWTRARWAEFKRDVASIARLEKRTFWNLPLRDRGYNPPPGWTLLGGTLCKWVDPRHPLGTGLLMWVDPALLLLAFAFSVRTYGFVRSAVVLSGLALWIGTHRLFGGKVLQYEWLAALWAALCCVRRERWGLAGALVAYATSVRIFPGALMLGPLAAALWTAIRERRWAPQYTRFFGAGAVTLALLVAVSGVASGRGLRAWGEFWHKNSIHQAEHKFNETRIGVPFLSTTSLESGISSQVSRATREKNYEHNAALRVLCQLVLVALVLLAARRVDVHDAMILSLALIFALAVSSRYYGAMYGLVLLLGAPLAARAPPFAARRLDLAFVAFLVLGYVPVLAGADDRSVYIVSNVAMLVFFLALLLTQAGVFGRLAALAARRGAPS